MNYQDKINKACALGVEAFESGKKCIPCHDKSCMDLLTGNQLGQGIKILDAWHQGWAKANLKE